MAHEGKWFKHHADASEGNSLSLLYAEGDYAAIAFWWWLLEYMKKWEDWDNRGRVTLSHSIIKRKLGWNLQRSSKVLLKIAQTFKIEVKPISDDSFEVFIPNWLKFNETRGGKREQSFSKKAGDERREMRDERVYAPNDQKTDRCGAITELSGNSLIEHMLAGVKITAQEAWVSLYGNPDWIKQELMKAHAWMQVNSHRGPKTKATVGRFLNNWLSRGWEQHRRTLPANQPDQSKRKTDINELETAHG